MDVLYSRGESSVAEVLCDLPNPPGYSAVRALLNILESKGHITHLEAGAKYVYRPKESFRSVAKSTLEQVVDEFFAGSVESAVATLLSSKKQPSDEELARLEELIQQARAAEENDKEPPQ
jgi:predicted transcriptional regulator